MVLDENKHKRQIQGRTTWVNNGCIGAMQYPTGFGKTLVLIETIQDMNTRKPDRNCIIIVPNTNLKSDWEGYNVEENGKKIWIPGHLQNFNLKNVRVFVINTFIKYIDWQCDLLLVDELHRILNEDSSQFSKVLSICTFKYFMGMTATLTQKQIEFLLTKGIRIIDTITQEEAIRNGWIAPSNTFNLAVKLKAKDVELNQEINDSFRSYFSKLNHEFEFVKACNGKTNVEVGVRLKNGSYLGKKTPAQWREFIAKENGFDGTPDHTYSPANIAKYAAQAMYYMRMRKQILQNYESKLDVAESIIKKFPDKKILVFCETSSFADKLHKRIPTSSVVYHTNLETIAIKDNDVIQTTDKEKQKALKSLGYTILTKSKLKEIAKNEFNTSKEKNQLITVRALDEGADFKKVDIALFLAYNSTKRQRIQREGRSLRIEKDNVDKRALLIYPYVENTQEEKWLVEAQKGKLGVRWIKSIEEITLDTIKLGSNDKQGIIPAAEIRIISNNSEGTEGAA